MVRRANSEKMDYDPEKFSALRPTSMFGSRCNGLTPEVITL